MFLRSFACAVTLASASVVALGTEPAAAQSWEDFESSLAAASAPRCATPDRATRERLFGFPFDPSDCSATETNPSPEYDPGALYEIPVVVHIIMDDTCTQGVVSDELVHSQIQILNEDYLALPGTNGGNGTDVQIRFVLAGEDPDGNPTTGITRDCNTAWYEDDLDSEYWNQLAWDPHNYLNLYTNSAGGSGGYVPFLPADGGGDQVGQPYDRVVINHLGFGLREGPVPEHSDGRLATHEIGHYLGLLHPFIPFNECGPAEPPGCYLEGDLICDTPVMLNDNDGCPADATSCGSPDPISNYMNYTDDLCMEEFTLEQTRRLRCTLQFYRPQLYDVVEPGGGGADLVAQEGQVPTGETDPIGSIGSPFVNGLGQVGFTGGLDTAGGTDSFVWFDDGIDWKNSDADANVLSGAEGTMGISDAGGFIYSPSTDGNDSVWTAAGLLAVEGDPAPGFPDGVITIFHSRPTMLPTGRAHWVAGFNDTDGSGTDGRVLYTSGDGTPGQIEVVLRSDDVIDGLAIDRPSGIDFDYDFSDSGAHHVQALTMDTGNSDNDEFVYVDGALVARESDPTGDGDNWTNFDLMSINDSGDFVFSGDTDGATTGDEFIAYNGVIVLREGDSVGDVELTSGASVNGLSINGQGALAHLWSISGGTELLFLSCDAANTADGAVVLTTGDEIDADGDGEPDAVVSDFNASTVAGPGIELGTSGRIFVDVDLDYGDDVELEAILGVDLPVCGGGGAPVLTFDPASLDFGDIEVGSSSPPAPITLTNIGDADATGLALTLTGDAFAADTSACGPVLEPAASCAVSVTFSPLVAGPAEGELSVTSDQGASAVATLEGNGVAAPEPTAACVWDTTLGNPGGSLNALGLWDGALYVGGSPGSPFNGVDNGVAIVDLATDTTSPLGTTELTDGFVSSLLPFDDGNGERLYIVGAFNGIIFDGTELPDSRGVVAWDGSATTTLPGSPFAEPLVFAQAATVFDGRLVIGGAGGAVDPPQKPVLTLWDGAEWTVFREEFTGVVAPVILAVETFQGDLYFGGRFTTIEHPGGNVVESTNIMGFDGDSFFSVGGGVERDTSPVSQVLALETFDDGTGEALYIGGRFDTSVDGEPLFAVAKWDGSELTAVGNGFPMPSEVRGFEVYDNGSGPALYAVGNFTQDTEGLPIERVAKLEDGEWVEVAGGAGENPNRALALPDGSLGFAGSFDAVGDSNTPGSGPASGFAQVSCLASLTISPTSHDFGTLDPGDTAGALFTVSNQTDADIALGTAATGGDAEFSIGDTDACSGTVLAGGASCQVEVVFDPAGVAGSFSGSLQLPSDANSVLATLSGSAEVVEPEGPIADISPAAFAFQVSQGDGDSDTLTVGNLGDEDLTWSLEEAEASLVAPVVAPAAPEGMPYTYGLAWTPELHAPVGASRAAAAAARGGEPVDDAGSRRSEAAGLRAGRTSTAQSSHGRWAPLAGTATRSVVVGRVVGRPLQEWADPAVLPAPQPTAVGSFTEGFDDVTQLPGAGWAMLNNSEPVGPTSWFQGNESIFPAHEGAPNAYIAANYESTAGNGTISNWLITPEVQIVNGTEACFWTRKSDLFGEFLDRLEVRMSAAGDSIDVGETADSVGDFTTLLLTIEPDLELPNDYPEEWTEYCVTVRERSREPVTGRFAFRYWVTDSGPDGSNGDYIGIDTVSVTQPSDEGGGCDSPTDIPWLAADPTSGTTSPEDSSPVSVSVDTTGLDVGDYSAQLCVTTNDPAAPLVAVPVSLTVSDGGPAEFEITTLLLEGDEVSGVGLLTSVANLAVNGAGSWIVEADTDNADTDADSVLVRDGALHLREGDPLNEPAGASLDSFDTVNLDDSGNSGWNFFLAGTTGSGDDSGVYFNTDLLIQEGELSTAPELSPDTPYIGFFEAKIAGPDSLLLMASVDDPAIPSTVDRVLVALALGGGGIESEQVLAKEGDVLPGQTETVEDFETGPHNFDLNTAGTAMFAADLSGDAAGDIAIYIGDAVTAQEGGASPVAGRNWASLSSPELSLANDGGYAFSGSLDGDSASNLLLVANGVKLVQEGDTLPAIEPFLLTGFGSGPVLINDAGQVLWFGDWDDPDTSRDKGLFLNGRLLVQEGVTVIDGQTVESLSGVQDGYAMSDDGRYVLFEATLTGGASGAFLLSFQDAWKTGQ